jgi:PAS domain S-box-containing protein
MRTPTKRGLFTSHVRFDAALLLALPFPACIYDPGSNIVFYSNSFFNQQSSVPLLELLEKCGYHFLTANDFKILNHRITIEGKLTTRRVFYTAGKVKSVEIFLSSVPAHNLVLFFFNEVWTQDAVFPNSVNMDELVQSIPEGIGLIDENNDILFCNRSFASFFGKKEQEITGCNILSVAGYPGNSIFSLEMETLQTFKDSNFEIQLNTPENTNRFVLVHAVPRKNKEGKYSGAFFTLVDITDRVNMERELIVAKDRALDADRLKNTFLANMSHEIRTPMNCIIGFSVLLKKPGLDRKKRDQYLDIINSRGKHLMDILNNILDISKIEENLIQLNMEGCNLFRLMEELEVYYQNELVKNSKDHIKLIVKPGLTSENSFIRTDIARLYQILSNLLHNAVKFTESGFIETGFYLDNSDSLVFYVKDSGIGIPLDKQSLIFERFRQVEESITRTYEGAGLGLTICRGLLKLMGGKIWVESDGMNGSTFYFTIPYIQFHENSVMKEEFLNFGEKKYDWSGRKILIVEDDPTSFEFLSEVLLPTQCFIQHANNGMDALNWFGQVPFDLVLLDIQLPEMDGYQIAGMIRKCDPDIPIIAQTAHAMSDDKQKCYDAGCNGYITKPLHFGHLLETINTFFLG